MNLLKNKMKLDSKINDKQNNFLCKLNFIIKDMEQSIFNKLELEPDQKVYIKLDGTEYEIARKEKGNRLYICKVKNGDTYTVNRAEKYMLFKYIYEWLTISH